MERVHSRDSNISPGNSLLMHHREAEREQAEQREREVARRPTSKRGQRLC
jgi:hypothetical protein